MSDNPSYIDYESFLDPSFSPYSFANSLILATNNPSDTPLDLSTPLSRVLFDIQEIDTHIHTLTTKSAVPLLSHTQERAEASERIATDLQTQVTSLTDGYQRLEKEVIKRYEVAKEVRLVTERLWQTVKIGRSVARCLSLGRQLEAQMGEAGLSGAVGSSKRENHRAMIRASNTLLTLRELFAASGPGQEGEALDRVAVVKTMRNSLVGPAENSVGSRAQQIIREFSMSSLTSSSSSSSSSTSSKPSGSPTFSSSTSATTFAQTEATKARTTSALLTLYLLSSTKDLPETPDSFHPDLLIAALTSFFQTALTSSLAALSRALTTLPSLERTLVEVSARCQNIIALEILLESVVPPNHPLLPQHPLPKPPQTSSIQASPALPTASPLDIRSLQTASQSSASLKTPSNLLDPLLYALDTSSLPSYFWRSLASSLAPRVQDILTRGGVSARTLRSQKERVREAIKDCVVRGSQAPAGITLGQGKTAARDGWEREVAVMVGSVVGLLGR